MDNKICFYYNLPMGCRKGDKCSFKHDKVREYTKPAKTKSNSLVVHCKLNRFDVYVGRPSKWGNPFPINEKKGDDRQTVIAKYEAYLLGKPELLADLPELKAKVLACHCAPKACHGDVLVKYANMSKEELDKITN